MTSYDIMVILLLASGAIIQIFVTLGCVLLARFWFAELSHAGRSLIAALSGCFVIVLPLIIVAVMEESLQSWGEFLGVFAVLVFICMLIAWLPARFATRRLDRLTQFDIETFT